MAAAEHDFAIHAAAMEGRATEVESLVNINPRLQSKRDQDGRVALHWAVARGQIDVVKVLADTKMFDPDVEDELGWTPLMMASNIAEGEDLVSMLLQKEADPKLKNHNGQTALHFAASKGNLEIAKELIGYKASARIRDNRLQLPLHRAAAAGWTPMVRLLLNQQSPVDAADIAGLTALHHAIAEGRGDTAMLLLKSGADSSKKDSDGHLAIDIAPDVKIRNFILSSAEREGIEVTTS